MIRKILSIKSTFFSLIPTLEKKSRRAIFLCLSLGIISLFLDSISIVSLSRLEILSNLNTTLVSKPSSLYFTLILLILIALFNILKTLVVARASSLIASDITKSIYKSHLEKKSQFKEKFVTENIGKNVTRELIRGAFACFLLLPINILSLTGILIGLYSGLGISAIKISFVIIFINLLLVLLFGNIANKLQYKGTKAEKELEIISKEILDESDELIVGKIASRKLDKLKDISFKTRSNLTYALSFFRVPGTIYPVINIAIILLAIKFKFISYEILVPFIYSMQRGNLSFSSFISSLTSIIGSRRQLRLVSDSLKNDKQQNLNYKVLNYKRKLRRIIPKEDICAINFPKSKRVFYDQNTKFFNNNYSCVFLEKNIIKRPIVIYGDSGSGKSTFLKELIGLTGNAKNNCCSFVLKSSNKKVISVLDCDGFFMSQDIFLPRSTLRDYLNDFTNLEPGDLYSLFNWNQEYKLLWPEICNFNEWISKDLTQSSYGEIKRLKFFKAFLSKSSWLALDEPTSGLDSDSVNNVLDVINNFAKKSIVFICTHETKLINNSSISINIKNNN